MPFLLYRLLFPIAFALAAPFYALRLWKRETGRKAHAKPAGYTLGIGQRFGRFPADLAARLPSRPWWLCSISVGETLIALKLARALHAQDPATPVVLSVTTSTGYELLLREAEKLPWIVPLYNPIDFRFAARAALRAIRPRALVLIEGGIWPNLLDVARREGIPVALACARLSPRSERRWKKHPAFARSIWGVFDLVCVPEEQDSPRFAAIGVPAARIAHTGNIKFDQAADLSESRAAEFRALVEPLGFAGPLIVAGSTWAPEEQMLADRLGRWRKACPALRLIVVPRHVERADEVARAFSAWKVVRRSQVPAGDQADVLLVDTTGELRHWYELATVVFVGKSMPGVAEVGGQNPGEPAALGRPVLFGPHMENFAPLVGHLAAREGAIQVANATELENAMAALLSDPARSDALGNRAREAVVPHQGATQRTAAALSSLQKP